MGWVGGCLTPAATKGGGSQLVSVLDLERFVSRLFRVQIGIIAGLALAHIAVLFLYPRIASSTAKSMLSVFDLEQETAVPTFFSAVMLLIAGAAAGVTAVVTARSSRKVALGWLLMSLCLAFVAVDEAAAIHDRLAGSVQQQLGTGGVFFIGWTLPYVAAVVITVALIFPLLQQLDHGTMRRLAVAAALFVFSGLGLEMIQGVILEDRAGPNATFIQAMAQADRSGQPAAWTALVMLEEVGEMAAVALGIRAILLHLVCSLGVKFVHLEQVAVTADERGKLGVVRQPVHMIPAGRHAVTGARAR